MLRREMKMSYLCRCTAMWVHMLGISTAVFCFLLLFLPNVSLDSSNEINIFNQSVNQCLHSGC